MLADPELVFEIEEQIDQIMPNFYNLFVTESPYRRMLYHPSSSWLAKTPLRLLFFNQITD